MTRLTIGVIVTVFLAALILAAGCTAPSSTTTPAPATSAATAQSALLFGEIQVKTLDGVNEVLEYLASGDEAEKTEALISFVESGVLADKFWDTPVMEQAGGQVRAEYSRVDDTRTATVTSALAIMKEYEANNKVPAENLQKFEDDFEAMRAAYNQYATAHFASLPAGSLDPSTATGAAISLQKMRPDLMVAVSESLEHVLIGEPEEMADFNTAMDQFNTKAAAFNATPFLRASGNAAVAQQYQEMMNAVHEFRVAKDSLHAEYAAGKTISPQTLSAFEAATDKLRASYNTLTASVQAKV